MIEWLSGILGMIWGLFLGDAFCGVFGYSYEDIELEKAQRLARVASELAIEKARIEALADCM